MYRAADWCGVADVDVAIGQSQTQGVEGSFIEPSARAMSRDSQHDFGFVGPEVDGLHHRQR